MDYDLELPRLVKEINSAKAKRVCLQLPDGLKMQASEIVKELESKTKAEIFIWAGSNFGGCDIPLHLEKLNFDLVINFGHAAFRK